MQHPDPSWKRRLDTYLNDQFEQARIDKQSSASIYVSRLIRLERTYERTPTQDVTIEAMIDAMPDGPVRNNEGYCITVKPRHTSHAISRSGEVTLAKDRTGVRYESREAAARTGHLVLAKVGVDGLVVMELSNIEADAVVATLLPPPGARSVHFNDAGERMESIRWVAGSPASRPGPQAQ